MSRQGRPSEAEIRRALAECMTVEDIDDAMGWPRGTARRRRWMSPQRGGLPFADAELAGVALWFRSTFEAWRNTPAVRSRRRGSGTDITTGTDAGDRTAPAVADDRAAELADDAADESATDGVVDGEVPGRDDEPDRDEPVAEAGDIDGASGEVDPTLEVVDSGYDLEIGQQVLARVQGLWRAALVTSRDRRTVLVEYRLDDTALGTRVRRVDLDDIRLPASR